AIHSPILYPFSLRLENAIVSYSRYLGKAFWPTQLSPLYPHPLDLLRFWQVIASAILLLLVTTLVIHQRRRGYLLVGWFWFLGSLVPMIGLVQVGEQAMADRYAYLPFVGLFVMACWGVSEWAESKNVPAAGLAVPALAVIATLGALTYRQIGYWRDSETLWSYALQVTSVRSYKAHFNLAVTYDAEGRYDEAVRQFREAIDPRDDDPRIHLGLGVYDQRHGHAQEAIEEFQTVLRLSSDGAMRADAYSNLGSAYQQLHDYGRAKANFAEALRLDRNRASALVGMGLLAEKSGDLEQAIAQYSRAMSVEPTAVGYVLLARALEQAGHPAEAHAALDKARQLTTDLDQVQRTAEQLLAY
ncbi:MAG TPA: tetratricopeptide repeat protein, partial [Terriglobales bacterium]|nr:tetratricopeptide repeat protein [Terriglobales bacterium]